ncbi:MAG TPA: hypothetical protein VHT05_04275 [Candidatus Elarobacter sp.]|nr:hypothetical protein [Candidatus Elarobacter sp.]
MIVTRQRKRRPNLARFLVPLAAIAATGFVLGFAPSRHAIASGPLKPVWAAGAHVLGFASRPLSFVAQQQSIADRNRRIRDLTAQLERQREEAQDAEARADGLQRQLSADLAQPKVAALSAPRPRRLTGPRSFGASSPADERRLAATWAAMEPENAAAVAMRLPDGLVMRVLAQMDADSAGAIMDALPTKVAVRLSRAVAQVAPVADR